MAHIEVVAGVSMVIPSGVVHDGWLMVRGEQIAAMGTGAPPGPVDWDLGGRWLVPGFVDVHCHGGGGAAVFGAEPAQIETVAATHRAHGTTSLVASLVADSYANLERDVAVLAEQATTGVIAGIHLEGPWISPVRRGGHRVEALTPPEPAAVHRLLNVGQGQVRMVTLAPELDHGLDAIGAIVAAGARAAVGHSDASYEVVRRAIDAGATVGTHLFNAMRPVHHREPGPVIALMNDERVTVELILDGVHLSPAVAAHVRRSAGAERVVLATDAMAATGFSDGDFVLADREIRVRDGVSRRADNGVLAGSTLTMDRAFAFAVRHAGFSVPEAVAATATVPARLLGIGDRVGKLAAGYDADLVVLDADFSVRGVMTRGTWAVSPDAGGSRGSSDPLVGEF